MYRTTCWAASLLVLSACALDALAQAYPAKPIRIIAPYPPGGSSDTIARTVAMKLNEAWAQPVVVENRSGVGGSIGTEVVAKAAPDGYTLLVGNVQPVAINNNIYKKLGYDTMRDLLPISLAVTGPQIVVVHPSVPAKTVKELINVARGRKEKDRLNYGSSGPGSISQLAAELFKGMAKVDMVHVPYKGSALITTDLVGGHLDIVFSDMAVMLPHVKSNRVRASGVTGPKPTPLVPGVPAVAETVPGFVIESWWGLLAPTGTPDAIVKRLNGELQRILQLNDVKERFASLGVEAKSSSPAEFGVLIKSELTRYAKLIKDIGITPE
ncbi:MAG: tripartite tricarboxylate transporter substrate binding protein [Betaproteobacteria bacterium]|nr:tripartite tricarboxylate transporter substrate binding protein [Betaproteobacteria bacterium]